MTPLNVFLAFFHLNLSLQIKGLKKSDDMYEIMPEITFKKGN